MPTRGQRSPVPFHPHPNQKKWLDDLASRFHMPRARIIRHAVAVARRHEAEVIKRIEEDR